MKRKHGARISRSSQRWALGLASLVAIGFLAACTVPSDPVHVAHAEVTNMCDVPIRAMVAEYPTDLAPDLDAENLTLIGPKDTARFAAPIYLPVGDTLSAWLVNSDASVVGTPVAVPLTTVRQDEATDGSVTFVVTAVGDLCPE